LFQNIFEWREGVRVGGNDTERCTQIFQGTYVVNSHTILVLQSRAMTFVVEPFHSRVKPKLGSRIINTINRKSDDLF
jgi:hypothetical protein